MHSESRFAALHHIVPRRDDTSRRQWHPRPHQMLLLIFRQEAELAECLRRGNTIDKIGGLHDQYVKLVESAGGSGRDRTTHYYRELLVCMQAIIVHRHRHRSCEMAGRKVLRNGGKPALPTSPITHVLLSLLWPRTK